MCDISVFVCVFVCVQHEDALAQAAFEEARRRTRDFEDRDRSHREDLEVRRSMLFIEDKRQLDGVAPHLLPLRPLLASQSQRKFQKF